MIVSQLSITVPHTYIQIFEIQYNIVSFNEDVHFVQTTIMISI